MNISYDKFIRTTDDYHIKAVQDIFKNYMTKEIYINHPMKECTVHLVNPSGQSLNC